MNWERKGWRGVPRLPRAEEKARRKRLAETFGEDIAKRSRVVLPGWKRKISK